MLLQHSVKSISPYDEELLMDIDGYTYIHEDLFLIQRREGSPHCSNVKSCIAHVVRS